VWHSLEKARIRAWIAQYEQDRSSIALAFGNYRGEPAFGRDSPHQARDFEVRWQPRLLAHAE
jgi:hypothetical protein